MWILKKAARSFIWHIGILLLLLLCIRTAIWYMRPFFQFGNAHGAFYIFSRFCVLRFAYGICVIKATVVIVVSVSVSVSVFVSVSVSCIFKREQSGPHEHRTLTHATATAALVPTKVSRCMG